VRVDVQPQSQRDRLAGRLVERLRRTPRRGVVAQGHTRDLLTTTATQALSTDVYGRIVQHLVETSSLMRAGATVITTATGEDLVVPKSTGFVTTNIIAEGATITESDPALSTVVLKSFKYSNFFQVSYELANDTPPTCSTSWPARRPCRLAWAPPATATT
jgi:HK97 family phage major capsid protein